MSLVKPSDPDSLENDAHADESLTFGLGSPAYKCTAPGPRGVTADRPDGGLDELWLLLLDDPSGLLLIRFRTCNARVGGGLTRRC